MVKLIEIESLQKLVEDRLIRGFSLMNVSGFIEAGILCLTYHQHPAGVEMSVREAYKGAVKEIVCLTWAHVIDNDSLDGWGEEAIDDGAVAIAALLVVNLTRYTVIQRSFKGTGFDYWLMEADTYQAAREQNEIISGQKHGSARLEVSGDQEAKKISEVNARIKKKTTQTDKSDHLNLPALIVVVEFSRPEAYMVWKKL